MTNQTCKNDKNPIHIKKRQLCVHCYEKWKRENPLVFKSEADRRSTVYNNFIKRYGFNASKDLFEIQTRQFWNLTEFGKKYSISRERASQLYKLIIGKSYIENKKRKTKDKNKDLVCLNDPRYKFAEYKIGNHKKGAETEIQFYNECKKRGYNINMLCDYAIDININGFNVEIKNCSKPYFYSKGHFIPYFRYRILPKQMFLADFFALYHTLQKEFFIIPNTWKEFKLRSIYILEQPSDSCTAKNRYWEYLGAWEQFENSNQGVGYTI